jgi:hypothetical protein
VVLSGFADETMIEKVCMIQSLKELRITACRFVTGVFLGQMAAKELEMLDVTHSEHMES